MRSARHWWMVGAVVALAGLALAIWWPGGESAEALTSAAERGVFQVATTARGELAAVNSVAVAAPRGWNNKVVQLVDEGTRVSPGDTLALFDTAQQTQRVDERRTSWESAQAELENRRATGARTLAERESTLRRMELSLEQSRLRVEALRFESASRRREADLDLRRAELDLQEAEQNLSSQREINAAELAKAEAEVRSKRLELERAERDLAGMTVTAPDSGMVVHRKIWTGGASRKVRIGDQVWQGQPIVELPDLTAFQVLSWVQEVDVHRVELGQRVVVTVDALQGRELAGEVSRIAPLARTEGDDKLKVFDVDVRLSGVVTGLLPGMTTQCRIVHQEFNDVVHIPLEAVHRRGDATVVYLSGGGEREVELGAAGEDRVIVESGVQAGERLLLAAPGAAEADAS